MSKDDTTLLSCERNSHELEQKPLIKFANQEQQLQPADSLSTKQKRHDEPALSIAISDLEKSTHSCNTITDLARVLPLFEAVTKTQQWDAIQDAVDAFWYKVKGLVELLVKSKSMLVALTASERRQLLDIEDWWQKRRDLCGDASRKLQSKLLSIVLQSSLLVPEYDTAMQVLKRKDHFTEWEQQSIVIYSMMRTTDKQGWSIIFKHGLIYSYQAQRLLNHLEKHDWEPLPGVETHFVVNSIDLNTKTLRYSVMSVRLLECCSDPNSLVNVDAASQPSLHVMTLKWLLGFGFQSQALRKEWSASCDGSGSASAGYQLVSRPKPGDIQDHASSTATNQTWFHSAAYIPSYDDIRDACERHLSSTLDRILTAQASQKLLE